MFGVAPNEVRWSERSLDKVGHGYWFVHLQHQLVPFSNKINTLIEQSYLNGNAATEWFQPVESSPHQYQIDFEMNIQKGKNYAVRGIRRIGFQNAVAEDQLKPLPLTLDQVKGLDGHPEHYKDKLVDTAIRVTKYLELQDNAVLFDSFSGEP
eukprot:TRINITY_DN67548_c7_g2_i1.p1 TRINITY_DN67548_c7_g2~~TRINITY_DN67548_c7_g2_i1.p1  ORF type:complete len:152 (-),score=3.29 TRINITY_DN67548_c7_g2_i1:314-769(-)